MTDLRGGYWSASVRSCYVGPDGTWDREYLRITAIFRLMKHGHADVARAKELAARPIKGFYKNDTWLQNTIELWGKAIERMAA